MINPERHDVLRVPGDSKDDAEQTQTVMRT